MTTTITGSNGYERLEAEPGALAATADADQQVISRLPAIFWAGVILFAANAAILLFVWFSPNLQVGMYGEESDGAVSLNKPSPFIEENVQVARAHKVKAPEKVVPVSFENPVMTDGATGLDATEATMTMGRSTPQALDVAEKAANFPRMSAALYRPEAAVHSVTTDVAPRRTTAQP